jgi:DNA end-binding protein Ku
MAMRSIWSGALNFGLINIPVKLYSAVEEKELRFHFLHKEDLSPIRFAKVCRSDGREVPFDDIVKGYEYQEGDYIVLTDEDFKQANPKKTKTIEIAEFVEEKDIDPIYFERPYFLEPDKNAEKPYALLREALKRSKKVGIAKYVIRNKEHLGAVKVRGKVLVLDQMKFKEEIRDPKELKTPGTESVGGKELEMAIKLIDQLTEKFKPEEFKDTYTEELEELISEKAKGHRPKGKQKAPQLTKVSDLMDVLRASLERERKKTTSSKK